MALDSHSSVCCVISSFDQLPEKRPRQNGLIDLFSTVQGHGWDFFIGFFSCDCQNLPDFILNLPVNISASSHFSPMFFFSWEYSTRCSPLYSTTRMRPLIHWLASSFFPDLTCQLFLPGSRRKCKSPNVKIEVSPLAVQ